MQAVEFFRIIRSQIIAASAKFQHCRRRIRPPQSPDDGGVGALRTATGGAAVRHPHPVRDRVGGRFALPPAQSGEQHGGGRRRWRRHDRCSCDDFAGADLVGHAIDHFARSVPLLQACSDFTADRLFDWIKRTMLADFDQRTSPRPPNDGHPSRVDHRARRQDRALRPAPHHHRSQPYRTRFRMRHAHPTV